MLPLYDRNNMYVRRVSEAEAKGMVDNGQAEAITRGGWRNRRDVEWRGVRLLLDRDYHWSPCALTERDAERAASGDDDPDFQAKLRLWKFIGDTRATRVMR